MSGEDGDGGDYGGDGDYYEDGGGGQDGEDVGGEVQHTWSVRVVRIHGSRRLGNLSFWMSRIS